MSIIIKEFTEEWQDSVKAFNQRLFSRNISFRFPETPSFHKNLSEEKQYPPEEYYLAIDDSNTVRGGYILQEHNFYIDGDLYNIGFIKLPLSEGIINKTYNMVGLSFIKHALKKRKFVYALGMGWPYGPLGKLLYALRWNIVIIPFYFYIIHPYVFLKNICILRKSYLKRIICDILALSGIGWLAVKMYEYIRMAFAFSMKSGEASKIEYFGDWIDSISNEAKRNYRFSALRDSTTLNYLYKTDNKEFLHICVKYKEKLVGLATLLDMSYARKDYFGNMRVLCLIYCHSLPGKESVLINSIKKYSRIMGFDILITNCSYYIYQSALRRQGFLSGPSNVAFAASPELAELFKIKNITLRDMHIMRGDGDGR